MNKSSSTTDFDILYGVYLAVSFKKLQFLFYLMHVKLFQFVLRYCVNFYAFSVFDTVGWVSGL